MALIVTRRATSDRMDFIPNCEYNSTIADDGSEIRELATTSPATFKLRYLSFNKCNDLRRKIKQTISDSGNLQAQLDMSIMFDIVKACLCGWENINDGDGRTVIFKTDGDGSCNAELLETLPFSIVAEVGQHCLTSIILRDELDTDHAKKLGN